MIVMNIIKAISRHDQHFLFDEQIKHKIIIVVKAKLRQINFREDVQALWVLRSVMPGMAIMRS